MQVALAWLLQRSPNLLLIPGSSSLAHLRENLSAATLRLPADVLNSLNAIAHNQLVTFSRMTSEAKRWPAIIAK